MNKFLEDYTHDNNIRFNNVLIFQAMIFKSASSQFLNKSTSWSIIRDIFEFSIYRFKLTTH